MGEKVGMASKLLERFLLVLVILVATTQAAADGHKSAAGARRRATAEPPVPITILTSAVEKGAVCLDGSPPAYHLDRGSGSGRNSWIVNLEGGGWCDSVLSCGWRKGGYLGSSLHMDKPMFFGGIMSASAVDNPDFYNWNRVMVRYCDGGSFAGEGLDRATGVYFRGQRIWDAAVRHLLSIGMASADRALLTGCSAGGLAAMLHCDQFSAFFAGKNTTVKCLADAGLFLDAVDVSGGRSLRSYFQGVVATHGVAQNLPSSCTGHLDATSCFFPQNIIGNIKTPIFLLNAAYDTWQLRESLAPKGADHNGAWRACKLNRTACNESQLTFLRSFRDQMVATVKDFSGSRSNGLFINSCFIHGQSEMWATWNAPGSPAIGNKGIGKSVGDWYFGRAQVKAIDCPYPCDNTCHHDI